MQPDHPLELPAFRIFLVGRAATAMAMTLFKATILWQLYDLTREPLSLAAFGLAQFIPAALASLPAGAVADSRNRRSVALAAQGSRLVLSVLVLVMTYTHPSVPAAFLVLAGMVVAAIGSFEAPARIALMPRIVGMERLARAVPVHTTVALTAFMAGPALCGFLIGWGGAVLAYAVDGVLVLISMTALASLDRSVGETERRGVTWATVKEGLRYVWTQPIVLGCMALDMMAVVFGGASALLPAIARDVLHVGPTEYGLLAASLDLGAVIATLTLLAMRPVKRIGTVLLTSVAFFGVAIMGFGLARTVPAAMFFYALAGAADGVSIVLRGTAIQLSTPEALRGRVSSVGAIFIGASNQIGAVESGVVAHFTDTRFSVVSGGFLSVIVTGLVAWWIPELRRYRGQRPVEPPALEPASEPFKNR